MIQRCIALLMAITFLSLTAVVYAEESKSATPSVTSASTPVASSAVTQTPATPAAPTAAVPATPPSVKPVLNTGDTAWMLVAAAMVLLMTPGLAFFYGGMVRQKNVLSTMMHSFVAMEIVGVQTQHSEAGYNM